MPSASKPLKRDPCTGCTHYFITYDSGHPYGCRAMGFKSRSMPAREILAATGVACVAFETKPQPKQRDS